MGKLSGQNYIVAGAFFKKVTVKFESCQSLVPYEPETLELTEMRQPLEI